MPDIDQLVARFGGHTYDGGRRALIPGPGHSRNDRSLSLWTNQAGRVVFFSHAGDTVKTVIEYLGMEVTEEEALTPSERRRAKQERERAEAEVRARKLRFCEKVWKETVPANGTLVQKYLQEGRGLPIRSVPPSLRFHPACPRGYTGDRHYAAMVALVQDMTGLAVGLHITYLHTNGQHHVGRIMVGKVAGAAVRLHEAGDELAVGEGIESMLAYSSERERPVWALLSTSQFVSFHPPLQVDRLWIAPDMDDKTGASLLMAQNMAQRITSAEVFIDAPPPGTDWNSALCPKLLKAKNHGR